MHATTAAVHNTRPTDGGVRQFNSGTHRRKETKKPALAAADFYKREIRCQRYRGAVWRNHHVSAPTACSGEPKAQHAVERRSGLRREQHPRSQNKESGSAREGR